MATVVFFLVLIAGIVAGNAWKPVWTAWFALRAARRWRLHWPFALGSDLPQRVIGRLCEVGFFRPVRMRVAPGFVMELDPRDFVTNHILMDGVWEQRITRVVQEELGAGAVFVDVGAHVGYYSLMASTVVGPAGRVVAIEPNRPTAERLRRNIVLSEITNIVVEEVACIESVRALEFFQAAVTNSGSSSLSARNADSTSRLAVRGMPLDLIVERHGLSRIDLVKMDVEGAELRALCGMRETIAKFRPKVITELRPELLSGMGASMEEVAAYFCEAGYLPRRQIDETDYLWVPDPAWAGRQLGIASPN